MLCSQCRFENREGVRFCEECGAKLELTCTACGTAIPPGRKFCGNCGQALSRADSVQRFQSPQAYTPKHLAERILTSKTSLEGERKQVTVLFADLKGSMELLADRDPEEARKILDPVLERMMEAVHRYEGTVNQVMGDGIMALFGAPLAHEDHAVRACYAALRMQDRVKRYAQDIRRAHGIEPQIRVGLNSGEVVVRAIGNDLNMDYTAVGQTTHLAARMEQLATPGTIRLTSETLRLAEGYVEIAPLGPVNVKGLSEPLEVYEVTGAGPARTRLQAAARRGLTRFVGRDIELEQLRRAQRLADNGRGQVIAIVGEAGVGKSRLVYELTHSHRMQGWLVLESASVSYGKATSYLPVIALLKGYFKIHDRDDFRAIREKLTGRLLTLDESQKSALPALLSLLDVPVEDATWSMLAPAERRQRTLDAVKRLLLREAREQPLLLIFEDLHWIDGETQALLNSLVDSLGSARLLLLVNYRPEYEHRWSSRTYYSQLRLDALPADSTEDLLRALLGEDHSLAPLKQLLAPRGNPFFLEETIRTLVETKALAGERGRYRLTQLVQTIEVPPTVQAVLSARIDRLTPQDKRLLQVASVVGKDVPLVLLQAIAELPDEALGRGLDHLQAAEFLYETGLFPEIEYTFKHAVTHEVTYSGLLRERRRELHARIVDAIETFQRDRLAEHIERLAHHAVRGELGEKAVPYLERAGNKAAERSALQDARGWFEQALSVLETLPASRSTLEQAFDVRLKLRVVLNLLGDIREQLHCLRGAETLAERLNDDHRRGRVCSFMTNLYSLLGELDNALMAGARALDIAGRLGDLELRILSTSYLVQAHHLRGDHERVVELATGNLAALPDDWIYKYLGRPAPPSIFDRFYLVMSLAEVGKLKEAAARAAEAIRLTEPMQQQHWNSVGLAYYATAALQVAEGDWAKARLAIQRALEVFRTGNIVIMHRYSVAAFCRILAEAGEATDALIQLQEGERLLEHHTASGIFGHRGDAYHSLGRAGLLLGRLDDARRFAQCAIESSSQQQGCTAHTPHLIGDIVTHPSRLDAESSESLYYRALGLAEPRGMRPLVAHCHAGLAKLYHRTGKHEQAQEHLTTATTMYREMGMTYWLEKAQAMD